MKRPTLGCSQGQQQNKVNAICSFCPAAKPHFLSYSVQFRPKLMLQWDLQANLTPTNPGSKNYSVKNPVCPLENCTILSSALPFYIPYITKVNVWDLSQYVWYASSFATCLTLILNHFFTSQLSTGPEIWLTVKFNICQFMCHLLFVAYCE